MKNLIQKVKQKDWKEYRGFARWQNYVAKRNKNPLPHHDYFLCKIDNEDNSIDLGILARIQWLSGGAFDICSAIDFKADWKFLQLGDGAISYRNVYKWVAVMEI